MSTVRSPAVAGTFYPEDATELAGSIAAYLRAAHSTETSASALPKAVIVPHAGYIYSGPIAARAYALLERGRGIYRRVVLLGPVHRVPVRGLALPGMDGFATPLGIVPVDATLVAKVAALRQVVEYAPAHAWEHSLEVQLPFLQTVLEDFTLLPLAVGDATSEEVAEVLEMVWGGPETLIVVSSDLSHFHAYHEAQHIDRATVQAILTLYVPIHHEQACGGTPLNGLLLAARHHRLQPELLDLRNSGDTAGDRSRVVGYAALAFSGENEHVH
ncbi:MAG: AmmeMemoRadiSam system protein B [Sulfuricella sp.]|nr:AmmeMemoRadiSam system protein B [Sulfuricella sp.]